MSSIMLRGTLVFGAAHLELLGSDPIHENLMKISEARCLRAQT